MGTADHYPSCFSRAQGSSMAESCPWGQISNLSYHRCARYRPIEGESSCRSWKRTLRDRHDCARGWMSSNDQGSVWDYFDLFWWPWVATLR